MNIRFFDSSEALSLAACSFLLEEINAKADLLLCAATGSSPTGTYQKLVQHKEQFSADKLRIIKLDEWGGVPPDHPQTCESYLQKHLIGPLQIPGHNYISFKSDSPDPEMECNRVQQLLNAQGPVDLCILGLGQNGHIALNEPADLLKQHCHVAQLSGSSMNHPMALGMGHKPAYGLTMGMADIMYSKKILFIVSGQSKAPVLKAWFAGKISTQLPASFLWMHPNVLCLCDKELYELATGD